MIRGLMASRGQKPMSKVRNVALAAGAIGAVLATSVALPAQAAPLTVVEDGMTFSFDPDAASDVVTVTEYNTAVGGPEVVVPTEIEIGGVLRPVEAIRGWAFFGQGITSVELPDSLTHIGYSAFAENQITELSVPGTVVSIEDEAFFKNQIRDLTLHEGLNEVAFRAFAENELTTLIVPASVTELGDAAFSNPDLEEVHMTGPAPSSLRGAGDPNKSTFGEGTGTTVYYPEKYASPDPLDETKGYTTPKWYGYDAEAVPTAVASLEISGFTGARENAPLEYSVHAYDSDGDLIRDVTDNAVLTGETLSFDADGNRIFGHVPSATGTTRTETVTAEYDGIQVSRDVLVTSFVDELRVEGPETAAPGDEIELQVYAYSDGQKVGNYGEFATITSADDSDVIEGLTITVGNEGTRMFIATIGELYMSHLITVTAIEEPNTEEPGDEGADAEDTATDNPGGNGNPAKLSATAGAVGLANTGGSSFIGVGASAVVLLVAGAAVVIRHRKRASV